MDGPAGQIDNRVNWNGKPSYVAVLRGIETLKRHGISFPVIAVVNRSNVDDPDTFYDFFASLGCANLTSTSKRERD